MKSIKTTLLSSLLFAGVGCMATGEDNNFEQKEQAFAQGETVNVRRGRYNHGFLNLDGSLTHPEFQPWEHNNVKNIN
ncbi:MAG: hypothetical protein MK135_05750 [Polyangiaceae bacterium]|nr:hypothetical protein [Polyangiaceae bacterium]